MNSSKQIALFFLSGMLALATVLPGCKKDDEPAPQLPPESSFVMNFNNFSSADDTLAQRNLTSYRNWGHAYGTVAVWNTIITVGLAVPVASFLESFNHEAVYHPDESNWTWSYNVTAAGQVYEAELTAYMEGNSVVWEMRVTKGNEFSDFLWYTGTSDINGDDGYWILMNKPSDPRPLLRIDWYQDLGGAASIRYTNVVPDGPENGGYILYGTSDGAFDRYYNIFNKGQDNMTLIEWNHTNLNGNIKDPAFYEDYEVHCWGTNLQDIVCP